MVEVRFYQLLEQLVKSEGGCESGGVILDGHYPGAPASAFLKWADVLP